MIALLRRSRPLQVAGALVLVAGSVAAVRAVRGRTVEAVRVERKDLLETLVVSGRVLARSKASLGSPVASRVLEVAFEEGDRVLSGQLLVRLDDREAAAAVAEARALLERTRGSSRRAAVEARAQAALRLELADRELARVTALRADGFVSEKESDDARKARDLARSELAAAAETARSAAPGGEDERAAEAALRAAEARLALLRVAAPEPGVVLVRSVEPGDVVSPGKVLVTVALERETQLLAQPDERNLPSLRVGQKARASADAYPDRSFAAEVISIAPGVDLSRGTVDVKLRVPDPPAELKTDMTLSVELEVGRRERVLVVPDETVGDAATAPWVLVVRGRRAVRTPVRLGARGAGSLEVVEGLAEGDVVVRRPGGGTQDGDRVRAVLPRSG